MRRAKFIFPILCVLAFSMVASTCYGQRRNAMTAGTFANKSSVLVCNPKAGPTNGLQVRIHPSYALNSGYSRWTFEVSRVDGTPFESDIDLEVHLRCTYSAQGRCSVHHLKLPQGSLVATQSVLDNKYCRSQYWSCVFFQDGMELSGLRSEFQHFAMNDYGSNLQRLVVGKEADFNNEEYLSERSGELAPFFREYQAAKQWTLPIESWSPGDDAANNSNEWSFAYESRIPETWLELGRFGSIWLPDSTHETLSDTQIVALRNYVRGGGFLGVTQVEDPVESKLLARIQNGNAIEFSKHTDASFVNKKNTPIDWWDGTLGMGAVACVKTPNFRISMAFIRIVDGSCGIPKDALGLRGVSEGLDAGSNYWNWLIPNVGRPPVISFVILVGLFAGIAGPALLWFSNRARRPSWLLFLFPSLAAIATLLIGLYAVFHDGFATLGRVRSYTWYDATQNEGFAWSRQTYFSGSPPSQGLVFGTDAELTPMNYRRLYDEWRTVGSDQNRWEDSSQKLVRFLGPREQRQVLVRHPVANLSPFEILKDSEFGIQNTMDEDWIAGFFVDEVGQTWYFKNVKSKSKATLEKAADPGEALRKLGKIVVRPEIPEGFTQGQHSSVLDWDSNNRLMSWSATEPWMERQISEWSTPGTWINSAGTFGPNSRFIPKRAFFIVIDRAQHLQRATQANESHSFHVLAGKW